MSLVEPKDVAIATLGASVAIAGLVLVFCGFLFSQADGFPPDTSDSIIEKYRTCGKLGTVPFLVSMIVAGLSFWWLCSPNSCAYRLNIFGFVIVLASTSIYGAATILFLLGE
jgi:hypothetical protein